MLGLQNKFKIKPNPLELENKIQEMVPTDAFANERLVVYYQGLIDELDNDLIGINPGSASYAKTSGMINALSVKLEQVKYFDREGALTKEYIETFHCWLQGKSIYNVPKNANLSVKGKEYLSRTPWGESPLRGPSIVEYLYQFIDKKFEFEKQLTTLKMVPPTDIVTAWLYFKYIVCPGNWLPDDFHRDFNWWATMGYQRGGTNQYGQSVQPIRARITQPDARNNPLVAGDPGENCEAGPMGAGVGDINTNITKKKAVNNVSFMDKNINRDPKAEDINFESTNLDHPANPNENSFENLIKKFNQTKNEESPAYIKSFEKILIDIRSILEKQYVPKSIPDVVNKEMGEFMKNTTENLQTIREMVHNGNINNTGNLQVVYNNLSEEQESSYNKLSEKLNSIPDYTKSLENMTEMLANSTEGIYDVIDLLKKQKKQNKQQTNPIHPETSKALENISSVDIKKIEKGFKKTVDNLLEAHRKQVDYLTGVFKNGLTTAITTLTGKLPSLGEVSATNYLFNNQLSQIKGDINSILKVKGENKEDKKEKKTLLKFLNLKMQVFEDELTKLSNKSIDKSDKKLIHKKLDEIGHLALSIAKNKKSSANNNKNPLHDILNEKTKILSEEIDSISKKISTEEEEEPYLLSPETIFNLKFEELSKGVTNLTEKQIKLQEDLSKAVTIFNSLPSSMSALPNTILTEMKNEINQNTNDIKETLRQILANSTTAMKELDDVKAVTFETNKKMDLIRQGLSIAYNQLQAPIEKQIQEFRVSLNLISNNQGNLQQLFENFQNPELSPILKSIIQDLRKEIGTESSYKEFIDIYKQLQKIEQEWGRLKNKFTSDMSDKDKLLKLSQKVMGTVSNRSQLMTRLTTILTNLGLDVAINFENDPNIEKVKITIADMMNKVNATADILATLEKNPPNLQLGVNQLGDKDITALKNVFKRFTPKEEEDIFKRFTPKEGFPGEFHGKVPGKFDKQNMREKAQRQKRRINLTKVRNEGVKQLESNIPVGGELRFKPEISSNNPLPLNKTVKFQGKGESVGEKTNQVQTNIENLGDTDIYDFEEIREEEEEDIVRSFFQHSETSQIQTDPFMSEMGLSNMEKTLEKQLEESRSEIINSFVLEDEELDAAREKQKRVRTREYIQRVTDLEALKESEEKESRDMILRKYERLSPTTKQSIRRGFLSRLVIPKNQDFIKYLKTIFLKKVNK